ncbi:MAG: zf-HC2 domain-containing protein [Longimicrobiales bacterium]
MTAPISCKEALERLYEYLDGELEPESAEEVQRHVEVCDACYPEVKFTTEFRDALQRAAHGQPTVPDGLREKVGQLLDAERE